MTEEEVEFTQGKSPGQLSHEALWFAAHTIIAIVVMMATVLLMGLFHPDADSSTPKIIGTLLAFVVPMAVAFLIAKQKHNQIARYVWLSGLIIFAIACVWVIDLPTGPGLCEHCVSLFERIRRTFFSINENSGLLAGAGLLIGCWIPLSLFGYAAGAKLGLDSSTS